MMFVAFQLDKQRRWYLKAVKKMEEMAIKQQKSINHLATMIEIAEAKIKESINEL